MKGLGVVALAGAVIWAAALAGTAIRPEIHTEDVDLFYRVYDAAGGHPTAEQLQRDYLDAGSRGLHRFAELRATTGARIAANLAKHPEIYSDAKSCLGVLPAVRERTRVALRKLASLYPQAHFPPVTLAVGRGKPMGVGTSADGVMIELSATVADDATPGTALIGIDHIPLAVKDLDQAIQTYRRLGFAIKPGRSHADGIHNAHVKFPDGAGIELITASEPTDDLTRQYLGFLSMGEGPAFVSFHTASLDDLTQPLEQAHFASVAHDGLLEVGDPALQWLFLFAGNNRSPTDRPEHFAHPNTADATLAVWIAGGDEARMVAFFSGLGAHIERKCVFVPDAQSATVATVANGEVIFLPQSRQLLPGHPIVGAVFHVRDLDTAERVLRSGNVRGIRKLQTGSQRSLFVPPQETRGAWLEFRQ